MAAAAGSSSRVLFLLPALALAAGVFFLLAAPGVVVAAENAAAAAAPHPGLEFRVGGPRGWRVPDANTSYDWWAMNNRFHVGDNLHFKYAANDSVLLVDRRALEACNGSEPLAAFADGATTFGLDRPGFFCFISGEPGHCERGQRLIVRVMVHPAVLAAAAPGPAAAPAGGAPTLPGAHGGGVGGRPRPSASGCSDASSAGDAATAAGVAVAAAMAALVGLVFMLQ